MLPSKVSLKYIIFRTHALPLESTRSVFESHGKKILMNAADVQREDARNVR